MRRVKTWFEEDLPGFVLLPWLVAAVTVLLLKFGILVSSGFRESALGARATGSLTLLERLFLFRSDVLLCFLVIPAALVSLTIPFRKQLRLAVSTTFALLVTIGLNLEVLVYKATGSFTSLKIMWQTAAWAIKSHDANVISVRTIDLVLIASEIATIAVFASVAFLCLRRRVQWVNSVCLTLFASGAIVSVLGSISAMPALAWSQPLLETATLSAFQHSDGYREMREKSVPELLQLYRDLSHYSYSGGSKFYGMAKDYNVLLFVLEATPAQVFDPAHDSLEDMPNVRHLRERAFISTRHYTTFPLTNRATFSIFTSLYTRHAAGSFMGDRQIEIPGLIRSLKISGYQTGFYGYVWKSGGERDDRMLSSLGFDRIVEPTLDPSQDREGAEMFVGAVDYVEAHDLELLHAPREDIRRWTAQKQRFAAAFFPELGHDPWRTLPGQPMKSTLERGHALAVHQDAWLGELVEELRRDGALENTIIVVTSDHGLRFLEYPRDRPPTLVAHGKIEDIVLRVPLLIYAPKVLNRTLKIDSPSSHIDISPTVLDLLGAKSSRELEQGQPIWNSGLANRRLFLSMDSFGATGYIDAGNEYFNISTASNATFRSHTLEFHDQDAVLAQSEQATKAQEIVRRQNSLQDALLNQLLTSSRPCGLAIEKIPPQGTTTRDMSGN